MFIVLVVFITQSGLDTAQEFGVSALLLFLIMVGLVKITKHPSIKNNNQSSQPITPSTSTPPNSTDVNNQSIVNGAAQNPSIAPTVSQQPTQYPKWIQDIINWLKKFSKPQRYLIISGSFVIIIFIIIFTVSLVGDGPDTTITGTWTHELGSVEHESSWVVTTTMWNVDVSDGGYLTMVVNENGTFSLLYNNVVVSEGTWEDTGDSYYFVYRDIDEILASVSYNYTIKGSKLYMSINAYFVKE